MQSTTNFPSFYIQLAEMRIEKYNGENTIFNFYSDIVFWQNLGLTFKDNTFVFMIKQNPELLERIKTIMKHLETLFKELYKYDGRLYFI